MPRKTINLDDFEIEEEKEQEPIKISKRTGKPVRALSEFQKETLAKGRLLAVQKRKDLLIGVDLEKRAKNIQAAKTELKNVRDLKQKEKINEQKEMYEKVINEPEEEDVKPKKKKIIKYVEESSESEEEIIVKRKKDKNKAIMEHISKQDLKKRLNDEQSNSLAKMLAPSYY